MKKFNEWRKLREEIRGDDDFLADLGLNPSQMSLKDPRKFMSPRLSSWDQDDVDNISQEGIQTLYDGIRFLSKLGSEETWNIIKNLDPRILVRVTPENGKEMAKLVLMDLETRQDRLKGHKPPTDYSPQDVDDDDEFFQGGDTYDDDDDY